MEYVERMVVTFLTTYPHHSRATIARFLATVHKVTPEAAEQAITMAALHNYVKFSAAEFAALEATGHFDPDEIEERAAP